MTEHRSVGTVMGNFQAGASLNSGATLLLGNPGLATDPANPGTPKGSHDDAAPDARLDSQDAS